MENTSPATQVCPFCGKAFKRLKTHLPHCKMARNMNGKSNSKEAETSIAVPQLELNCKSVRSPASPSKKMKVKANSAKTSTQKKQTASTKKQNNSTGVGNESWTSDQTVWSKGFNEPHSSQGDLMDKREESRKKSQQSVNWTTKGQAKEEKKEMGIKTKSSEHFLEQDHDDVDLKLKSATRAKVKSTQKIAHNNFIKKEQKNSVDSSSRLSLNEKRCADLIPKIIFFPKVKSILNLEGIQIRPEFEKETAVLDLQAHVTVPQSSGAGKTHSLHFISQENMVPPVDTRCQTDQNEVTKGMVSNKLTSEQSPLTNIKTSVWHHIKENLCRTTTSAKQDFILKVNTSVKEDDYRADNLETSHRNSSTNNHVCSVIMASVHAKGLNKHEGNLRTGYVAVKKIEPSDWTTNGAVQSENLHLLQKENAWNKDMFLSTSSSKTVCLDGRIKELHPRLCTKTEIGMDWFPELYPGYQSIGLRMLPEQTKQLETPMRLSTSLCENTKGYRKYYNKYISARRGVVGGAITLFLGCASFNYIWNYNCIKHDYWRKHH
ncbi:uncharacterized protein si:dkey-21c1.4 [Carcharodon carcharias]|uniref:uncharacterized protein si:dkey-21c1.4 n=1 Tax=Carcharodon carcharias TaxID=13397 RepID=UPI001B7E9687|nr:uncharacterized protein si:dkey-21c1.4 [Carcharodon carcharias]XP_041072492.1 uncharacterized protein si:dkey-21c1.4 [Carcharodon carcharias]XP_041072493.1 uncharacterized protein si:dkey-21c1.4 [Carcharodon carcharias]XP_041072494.1 uncharacterized protein si:dkey-21c1.4 [Carcharodon carcharias]